MWREKCDIFSFNKVSYRFFLLPQILLLSFCQRMDLIDHENVFLFCSHEHLIKYLLWEHQLFKVYCFLAWRIPWTGEPGGLPSMGSHKVGHDWSDLAVAAASTNCKSCISFWPKMFIYAKKSLSNCISHFFNTLVFTQLSLLFTRIVNDKCCVYVYVYFLWHLKY